MNHEDTTAALELLLEFIGEEYPHLYESKFSTTCGAGMYEALSGYAPTGYQCVYLDSLHPPCGPVDFIMPVGDTDLNFVKSVRAVAEGLGLSCTRDNGRGAIK